MPKSIGLVGARVWYCGHQGYFHADISKVENVYVVRACGPVRPETLLREELKSMATHHMNDFPGPNFWRPDLGVFVVPMKQLKLLQPGVARIKERDEWFKNSKAHSSKTAT